MRTRKDNIDNHYIKDIPQNEKQEIIKNIPEQNTKPSLSPYQKHLSNNRTYYQKNKETIINWLKEYNKSIPKEDVNRKRILYYLNGDKGIETGLKNRQWSNTIFNILMEYIHNINFVYFYSYCLMVSQQIVFLS